MELEGGLEYSFSAQGVPSSALLFAMLLYKGDMHCFTKCLVTSFCLWLWSATVRLASFCYFLQQTACEKSLGDYF